MCGGRHGDPHPVRVCLRIVLDQGLLLRDAGDDHGDDNDGRNSAAGVS